MPGVPLPPGYIRPDPDRNDAALPLAHSLVAQLNNGRTKTFPRLCDYLEFYVRSGIINDEKDLVENYAQLIGEIFFHWIETGQLGCLFAVKLAKRPRESRWMPIVQLGALDSTIPLAEVLNSQLDAAAESNEAAALIFPDVNGAEKTIELINALCRDPANRWYWTENGVKQDDSGDGFNVGLRWVLADDTSVNFVLGFADLELMPLTRRAPFTALFLRIRPEKRTPSHREDGRLQVHLADLDSTFHRQEMHDLVFAKTQEYRASLVEPRLEIAAKAKVSFSIPRSLAASLCSPRVVTLEPEIEGDLSD